jgi:signal transduction histidine kinase
MRSLALKLTLAFLFLGLTLSGLIAISVRQGTRNAFNQFILDSDQQNLVDNLEQFYQTTGSWAGVNEYIQSLTSATLPSAPGNKNNHRERLSFTLVNADKTILFSHKPNEVGQKASGRDLERAIQLEVDDKDIGWLVLLSPRINDWNPNSPEAVFLKSINHLAVISALVAVVLALILGSLMAFTMTRSLRELTDATVELARGRLGKQVKVRSHDEIGRLAASFNQMSSDLARATQARRQMTADIAHDLRSPLSVLAGYTEALSDGKLPGSPEVYDTLYQETQQLSRLVEDLRTLSLAEAGELHLNPQPTQPKALLERVAARHAVAAQQKEIALTVEVGSNLRPIDVDPERMVQVFDNLVSNAFRYTPTGGKMVLAGSENPGAALLQVQDSGSGIAQEDLPFIFDRSYRGDKSRRHTGESGLGLAIAKSIVEAQGGTISVESLPGQGATFTISLPFVKR